MARSFEDALDGEHALRKLLRNRKTRTTAYVVDVEAKPALLATRHEWEDGSDVSGAPRGRFVLWATHLRSSLFDAPRDSRVLTEHEVRRRGVGLQVRAARDGHRGSRGAGARPRQERFGIPI